jgi:hypothetical protein
MVAIPRPIVHITFVRADAHCLVNAQTGQLKSSFRLGDLPGVELRYTISFDIPAYIGREMRHIKVFCFAFWLALCSSIAVNGQNEASLSSRILEALKTKEPGWKPIATIENRMPLVPSERRILTAVWASPKSRSEDVDVSVYSVENHREAAAWLGPVRNRQVAAGWQVSTYQIGEEGYLSKYKNGERFDIEFRRGNVVAKIAGNDLRRVKDFARCVIDQIPSN